MYFFREILIKLNHSYHCFKGGLISILINLKIEAENKDLESVMHYGLSDVFVTVIMPLTTVQKNLSKKESSKYF